MRGFFQYIPPFAPDYSGAVGALFQAGGLIVLCDPGGCSGNVAGYDEPRFYGSHAAFFSGAIRELDTIFGRDDKLEQKILAAANLDSYAFLALVGTPVVSVIGTDLEALARRLGKATGIPAFGISTTGMADYSVGEHLALLAYGKRFLPEHRGPAGDKIGIFGATPLNAAGGDNLPALMRQQYGDRAVLFSEAEGPACLARMEGIKEILCLSPSCVPVCRMIRDRLGIPYQMDYPASPTLVQAARAVPAGNKRVLILHQQAVGNTLRTLLREKVQGDIIVGTFFQRDSDSLEEGDLLFQGEDELVEQGRRFDVIVADPLYRRALEGAGAVWVDLPHRACSGELYL